MTQPRKIVIILLAMLLLLSGAACAAPEAEAPEIEAEFPLELVISRPKTEYHSRHAMYHLTSDGRLYGWGNNYYYLLGLPLPEQYDSYDETVLLAEEVADIAIASNRIFMLKTDGSVWVMGEYPNPDRDSDFCEKWVKVTDGVAEISNVTPSARACMILKTNGDMYACGDTTFVQTEVGGYDKNRENGRLRLVDTGVSRMGRGYLEVLGESEGRSVYEDCFLYYKGSTACGFTEREDMSFETTVLYTGVKYVFGDNTYYIDTRDNLYFHDTYAEGFRPPYDKKDSVLIAKDVADCFYETYLDKAGRLYMHNDLLEPPPGTESVTAAGKQFFLMAEGVKAICREENSTSGHMMYFLKEDNSLWAFNEAYFSGTGDVPPNYGNNFPTAEMKYLFDEPVKVLDNVKEFSFSSMVKLAETEDGQRYIWGLSVKLRDGTHAGWSADEEGRNAEDRYVRSRMCDTPEEAQAVAGLRNLKMKEDTYLYPTPVEEIFESFCE